MNETNIYTISKASNNFNNSNINFQFSKSLKSLKHKSFKK